MKEAISILGCGWLGIPLAKAFIKQGHFVRGSVTSEEKKQALSAHGIEPHVIHLGEDFSKVDFFNCSALIIAVPPRRRSQEAGTYKAQVKKTVEFIAQLAHVKQVLYTSSTSVYRDEDKVWEEQDLVKQAESANEELFEVEELFLSLQNKKVCVLRLGGLTGGNRMLAKHFSGKENISGGSRPVNLVHVEDVVSAIQFVLTFEKEGVYNLCSSEHPSKKVFYTRLCEQFDMALPAFQPEEGIKGKVIDSAKIQREGFIYHYPDPFLYTYDV
jgi:nucleoside-diphosphate-sugar epimerase